MSGYIGDLSDSQAAALAAMKAKLGAKLEEPACRSMTDKFCGVDACCLRYLRFYNFSPDSAVEKFLNTLQWRIENKVDEALINSPIHDKVRPFWPGAYCGTTKDGLPVQFFNAGYTKPAFIMNNFTEHEMRTFYIYWMETSLKLQRESTERLRQTNPNAPPVRGTVEIYDIGGLSLSQLHIPGVYLLASVLSLGSTHYPSNLVKGFIINSGIVFSTGWKIISPVLHAQTRERLVVDKGPCADQLAEAVGAERVPEIMASVKPPPDCLPGQTSDAK